MSAKVGFLKKTESLKYFFLTVQTDSRKAYLATLKENKPGKFKFLVELKLTNIELRLICHPKMSES